MSGVLQRRASGRNPVSVRAPERSSWPSILGLKSSVSRVEAQGSWWYQFRSRPKGRGPGERRCTSQPTSEAKTPSTVSKDGRKDKCPRQIAESPSSAFLFCSDPRQTG